MNHCRIVSILVLTLAWAQGGKAHTTNLGIHTFTVRDGFELEMVAGPPLVDRPIVADFDLAGNLYVADSSGTNDRVEKQLVDRPHRIVRLTDSDGDGIFDKRTIFADRMMFPEGILFHDGAVYVAAPPSIWKLEDRDGDGVAEFRSEWFHGKTLTGCANDLHGPYLGPDGFLYWCKGAFAQQKHDLANGGRIDDSAAHIYRSRPDGSGLDSIMSGGMDNPVEVAFSSSGEIFFTTTFYTNPSGGKRDALVHAIYGGVYPKVHGVLDGLIRTGDLMPAMTHLGPAAPSGLLRYESPQWGPEYTGNLFAAMFNLRKVTGHRLIPEGSTYRTEDFDLVESHHPDFHPTDVLEDADGSLLIIDTGGWYKLCCPTSQLSKPDVLGAIYRVRKKEGTPLKNPRLLDQKWYRLSPSQLVRLLIDSRPGVWKSAGAELQKRGPEAVGALAQELKRNPSPSLRERLVWNLGQLQTAEALDLVAASLQDADGSVRGAAIHLVGLHQHRESVPALIRLLKNEPAEVRRAATALGQIRESQAVPFLFGAAATSMDRPLEHAIVYALVQINDAEATRTGLDSPVPEINRVALLALNGMQGKALSPALVLEFFNSQEPLLKQTAQWILQQRPEWAAESLPALQKSFEENPGGISPALVEVLSAWGRQTEVQQWLGEMVRSNPPPPLRNSLLSAMLKVPFKQWPAGWEEGLIQTLASGDEASIRNALAIYRGAWQERKLTVNKTSLPSLLEFVRSGQAPLGLRLEAMALLPPDQLKGEPFELLLKHSAKNNPATVRQSAAQALARPGWSTEQLHALIRRLPEMGPMELRLILAAFEQSGVTEIGRDLLQILHQHPSKSTLAVDQVKKHFANFSEPIRQEAEVLCSTLRAGSEQQSAKLQSTLKALPKGDARRGQLIFLSEKAACFVCHEVGYRGGDIGPDLTKVGSIRTEKDLLESILFPSASFARGYEPVVVTLQSGETESGILQEESPGRVHLIQGHQQQKTLDRSAIKDITPGATSVMPEGLISETQLQEMADVIAFLKSLK